MWKRKVEDNLLGNLLNFDNLVKELRSRNLTGFIKIEGWDFTDYVIFFSGKPLRVVRKLNNKKEFIEFVRYNFPVETKVSVYESSPLLTAHLNKELSLPKHQTLLFSGYGDEVFFSQLEIIDFKKFEEFLKKSNFIGYFTLYTPVKVLGNFLCLYGEIVGINTGTLWDSKAFEEIRSYGENRFISAYHIPPEEVYMLLSIKGGLKEDRNDTGFNVSEDGTIQFVHDGLIIKNLRITDEEILEMDIPSLLRGTFYKTNFREDYTSLKINLNLLLGIEEQDFIEENILNKIKEIFIDSIGPIGEILFKKILGEYSSTLNRISRRSIKAFIKRLENEIPEENLRQEFRKKLEEVINEINS